MSMELFKGKADLIEEIKNLELKVRLTRHLLELKEKDNLNLVSINTDLKKRVEELEQQLNNSQKTFTWR